VVPVELNINSPPTLRQGPIPKHVYQIVENPLKQPRVEWLAMEERFWEEIGLRFELSQEAWSRNRIYSRLTLMRWKWIPNNRSRVIERAFSYIADLTRGDILREPMMRTECFSHLTELWASCSGTKVDGAAKQCRSEMPLCSQSAPWLWASSELSEYEICAKISIFDKQRHCRHTLWVTSHQGPWQINFHQTRMIQYSGRSTISLSRSSDPPMQINFH